MRSRDTVDRGGYHQGKSGTVEKFTLAVWFQTADDGTVTMKVFFKPGRDPSIPPRT